MNYWATFPFLRYVFWLISGIVAGRAAGISGGMGWKVAGLAALLYLLCFFFGRKLPKYSVWQGCIGCVLLLSIGFARVIDQKERIMPEKVPEGDAYWVVKAESEVVTTPKTVKVQARIMALKSGNKWEEREGKVLLYIQKEGIERLPERGSVLLVKAPIQPVPAPLNPAVFNYKNYLEMQGICCQAFISADNVKEIGKASGFLPIAWAAETRKWALRQVEKYVKGRQEVAIISSLVLGHRETLDQELVQAYSTAGTMHVLAVSGLHVGFLYLFLKIILGRWRRKQGLKWVSFFIILLVLWGYAFVTGLSPSVLRAVIMFSLVDAALLQKRRTSIYNSLALAAFVLLIWDPFMLWAVGFQLSFLAVLGIVYLQPRLSAWYSGKNKAVRWVWDLLAVSLAAQFATFALSLYYFGQFPTYFFLTNLIVVPAAFLMLTTGFLVLLLSLVSEALAAFAGAGLFWLVKGVNGIVFMAESFPYSRLSTHITELQLWVLLLVLIFLVIFFHYKRFRPFIGVFFLFTLLIGSFINQSYQQKKQKRMLVYHIPGHSLLHLVEGGQEFFMGDPDLPPSQVLYQVQPNRSSLGFIAEEQDIPLRSSFQPARSRVDGYSVVVWRGKKVVKVEKPLAHPCEPLRPVEVDYILLTQNTVKDLAVLHCYFTGGTILIDGSNKPFVQKKLEEQAEKLNLPYHLTSKAGAFEITL